MNMNIGGQIMPYKLSSKTDPMFRMFYTCVEWLDTTAPISVALFDVGLQAVL